MFAGVVLVCPCYLQSYAIVGHYNVKRSSCSCMHRSFVRSFVRWLVGWRMEGIRPRCFLPRISLFSFRCFVSDDTGKKGRIEQRSTSLSDRSGVCWCVCQRSDAKGGVGKGQCGVVSVRLQGDSFRKVFQQLIVRNRPSVLTVPSFREYRRIRRCRRPSS